MSVRCGRLAEGKGYETRRGLPRKFARFVPFRPIKKRSFNLLCVLDLPFRTLAVNSVLDFYVAHKVPVCHWSGKKEWFCVWDQQVRAIDPFSAYSALWDFLWAKCSPFASRTSRDFCLDSYCSCIPLAIKLAAFRRYLCHKLFLLC